jgi:hypothetical protein
MARTYNERLELSRARVAVGDQASAGARTFGHAADASRPR